ncbi:hypothetical protein MKZ38_008917 [Zalerion maritima]|uniref:Manganese lipoxygenase n=1 Tax=Zalerion maritima TaxID=339359 RepID=A0AAD5WNE4_9PEZI|nr:hypothetical protein MKZ38_008917 [Zalerion maritima]
MSSILDNILYCCKRRGEHSDSESDSEPEENVASQPKTAPTSGPSNNSRAETTVQMDPTLPAPPPSAPKPDPEKILEQPATDDRFAPNVADVTFSDIDPGVFNAEFVSEGLFVKPDPNNPGKEPSYQGGNVTQGTYSGTQAALTHLYDRIEKAYESYFDVLQIEPTLPKQASLAEKRQIYQWSQDPQYPPHLETIPKKDQVAQWQIFNALGLVETQIIVNKVIPDTFIGKTKAWLDSKAKEAVGGAVHEALTIQELVDYNMNNRKSGTDILRGENLGHLPDWFGDRRFADQAFTGTNPVTIEKCSKELLKEFMAAATKGGYSKWEEELPKIDANDLFVQDYSYFRDAIKAKAADEELSYSPGKTFGMNWAVAAVTLFQLHDDGKLHPIAICCDYKGTMDNSVTIFNSRMSPKNLQHDESLDFPWRYAKTCASVSDWLVHELAVHLTHSHFIEEAVIVATNRSFDPEHIVYRILYPHWYKTLSLNAAARATLVPQVVKDIIGFQPDYAFEFIRYSYTNFDFVGKYVPNDLKNRGFPCTEAELKDEKYKNYGYAVNIVPMWNSIRKYVMSMLLLHYNKDQDQDSNPKGVYVKDDLQVKAWCDEVHGPGGLKSFPTITTLNELCDAITMCIHIAAPYHSTVNYLQNFYFSFVAAKPPSLCYTPPATLKELKDYKEPELARALPIGRQRQWLLAAQVPWLLSFKVASDRSLINFAQSQWLAKRYAKEGTADAEIRDISEHFYLDLRTLHLFVNETTKKMDPGSVPYIVMDPGNTAVSILI